MSIKTSIELAEACKKLATNYKTLYVLGCFGAPMSSNYKQRYIDAQEYNRKPVRKAKINNATADTFGFDCVCMIKALLWGWTGDVSHQYGGAKYNSNGVPDIDDTQMINVCSDVSTDFSNIQIGEVVWISGHIGVYVGDGLVIECTPSWKDGVQATALLNIGTKSGYTGRKWTKHGKLPYVEYPKTQSTPEKNDDVTVNLPMIQTGSKGTAVKVLQTLLVANKFSVGVFGIDGSFGDTTKKAVVAYQVKNNLEADGIVGPKTWMKLLGNLDTNKLYQQGSNGYTVKIIQAILMAKGYSVGFYGADGDFGKKTKEAVIKYQRDNGLEQDGIVGRKTWAKLLSM